MANAIHAPSNILNQRFQEALSKTEGNFMRTPVRWLREPGEFASLRKVIALILVVALTITGVGLLLVVPGIKEWNRQTKLLNQARQTQKPTVDEKKPEEETPIKGKAVENPEHAKQKPQFDIRRQLKKTEENIIKELKKYSTLDNNSTFVNGLYVICATNEKGKAGVLSTSKLTLNEERFFQGEIRAVNDEFADQIKPKITDMLKLDVYLLFKGNNKEGTDYFGEVHVVSRKGPAFEGNHSGSSKTSRDSVKRDFEDTLMRLGCQLDELAPFNLPESLPPLI